ATLYADDGFTATVIPRVLNVAVTAGNSGASNLDPLKVGNDLIYGDAPGSTASDVFGDFNDVLFGDLGDIGQATSGRRDTTKPISLVPQRIETTLLARSIISQERQRGGRDTLYGNARDHRLIGGAGERTPNDAT